MRKIIILAFVFATFLTTSCNKDEIVDSSGSENVSGTTWKATSGTDWYEGLEYSLLIFTSATEVEGWRKLENAEEEKNWTGTYTVSNDKITISYEDGTSTGTIEGIIEGEKMNVTIGGDSYVFIKQ